MTYFLLMAYIAAVKMDSLGGKVYSCMCIFKLQMNPCLKTDDRIGSLICFAACRVDCHCVHALSHQFLLILLLFLHFLQGKYAGTAVAADQNGEQIFCIKIDINIA